MEQNQESSTVEVNAELLSDLKNLCKKAEGNRVTDPCGVVVPNAVILGITIVEALVTEIESRPS